MNFMEIMYLIIHSVAFAATKKSLGENLTNAKFSPRIDFNKIELK